MNRISNINAAIKKIGFAFGDSPEEKLFFKIVAHAIHDLRSSEHHRSAKNYLRGDIVHAQACGVDADWIRRVLKDAGVKL